VLGFRDRVNTVTCKSRLVPFSAFGAYCGIIYRRFRLIHISISAIADGPRDAASHKIDHIVLPTKHNYQAMSL